MRWTWLVIGALVLGVGALWTLQGIGVVEGSPMTGETIWAIIGPIVAIGGLALLAFGLRKPGPPA
jgi:hypothetical protein